MLADIGIIGWDQIEPTIIASIAMDISVMLEGSHGVNKTTGSQKIARAIIGDTCNFASYDVPFLNVDELLGYINPKKLAEGELDYIKTDNCIWQLDACLLDELNKATLFTQNRLLEVIRSRSVHGSKTKLQIVFSACNRPGVTDAAYMDHPKSSRFATVHVPGFQELTDEQRLAIIEQSDVVNAWNPEPIRNIVKAIREYDINNFEMRNDITTFTNKLASALTDLGVKYETRQAVMLRKLLIGVNLYAQLSGVQLTEDQVQVAVLSTIPEVTGLLRTNVDHDKIKRKVAEMVILGAFKDVINFKELLNTDPDDPSAWLTIVNRNIASADKLDLTGLYDKLQVMLSKNQIDGGSVNKTLMFITARLYCLTSSISSPIDINDLLTYKDANKRMSLILKAKGLN